MAKQKIQDELEQKAEAKEHQQKFEKKYKCTFIEFEKEMPKEGDFQLHEDYVKWSFWEDVLDRIEKDLRE